MRSARTNTVVLLALVGLAFGSIVAGQPNYVAQFSGWGSLIASGLYLGTFFAAIALASAWTAYGYSSPIVRIAQSLAVCALAVLASVLNALVAGHPPDHLAELATSLPIVAIGQYLLIAGLLWPLLATRGMRLCQVQNLSAAQRAASEQFGIRDLLIAMAATAILLGAGRWIVAQHFPTTPASSIHRTLLGFSLFAVCNTFLTIPLLVAPLIRRYAVVGTIFALVFAVIVTACQLSAWTHLIGPTHPIYVNRFGLGFSAINVCQVLWVLTVLVTVRAGGYCLAPATKVTSYHT